MWHYIVKVALTATVVVAVSEVAKRSTFWGAVLASLPVASLLAFVWLYLDTADSSRVAALSQNILWLVIPSLTLFIVLPVLLRSGVTFWASLAVACMATVVAYLAMVWCLNRFGIRV